MCGNNSFEDKILAHSSVATQRYALHCVRVNAQNTGTTFVADSLYSDHFGEVVWLRIEVAYFGALVSERATLWLFQSQSQLCGLQVSFKGAFEDKCGRQ